MKTWMSCLSIFLILVCVREISGHSMDCTDGQFFNLSSLNCQNCSMCLLLIRDCTNVSDTVCARFTEFRFRNEITQLKYDGRVSVEVDNTDIFEKSRHSNPVIEIEELPTTSSDDQYWKNLAFALIGVLCVLIIVATMVVWYACRKLQASVQMKRPDDDDSDDADNGYVVIRSLRHIDSVVGSTVTSQSQGVINATNYHLLRQQRLFRPYRPKRRLLNEYADDVFESEDSGGSRTSRRILSSIPEQSDLETTAPSSKSPEMA